MDSDSEDVSENDILDWYKSEVEDIWDTATDSAFSDLSANFTDMFRQVMNNIKQRSQPNFTNGHMEVNGHSSTSVNGVHSDPPTEEATNLVTVHRSADQLMELLQDDEEWLQNDGGEQDEEMTLSVQLTDNKQTEEDQKNVKGVSQETEYNLLADSILLLLKAVSSVVCCLFKCLLVLVFLAFALYAISLLHSPLQRWFLRHMQDYIYPSMRLLRLATLPLLHYYPSLTDWHEETCLVANPLYAQHEIDCWSCGQLATAEEKERVNQSVFQSTYYHTGIPLLIKGIGERVALKNIQQMYVNNKRQFLQGIGRFSSLNQFFSNISHFLDYPGKVRADTHVSWKVYRVGTGRLFRQLFKRPLFIPHDTEVALHKYLFVDGTRVAAYKLPMTEFANVWVSQGSGSRMINLTPSAACSAICAPIKTTLCPGDLLYYNWQFWNAVSEPAQFNVYDEISVTYVGSFY